MKHPRLLIWFFLMILAGFAFAGDVQVSCESGLRIFFDGDLVGVSSALEDGLSLVDVKKGAHTIRVEKDGFLTQTYEVEVLDLPIEVVIEKFVPAPATPTQVNTAVPEVKQRVGSLVVTSAPQNCEVEIDGRKETKTAPFLLIGGLAVGEHEISFSRQGYDTLSDVVMIQPGSEVTVRGNLKEGKVETLHEGKGSLRLVSKPQRCKVHFRGEYIEKSRQKLNRTHIPAGFYPIVVEWRGMKFATKILITSDQRTLVSVDFMARVQPFEVSYEPE